MNWLKFLFIFTIIASYGTGVRARAYWDNLFYEVVAVDEIDDELGDPSEEDIHSFTPPKDEWYPKYHLAPPSGWMNDPNGLIYFDGYYHAFYQHNPYAPIPEKIHWGHARSKDLVVWEHLPVALAPSLEEDSNGCFSGSAVDDNGKLTLIYTGNSIDSNNETRQVQMLATSDDGINFVKEGKILESSEHPHDFRDPKVWRVGDSWYMVLGAHDKKTPQHGQALLYKSDNLRNWTSEGILAKAKDGMGYMWECPDFYPLKDKYVLAMSPQGVPPDGYKYRNLDQTGYFVGTWQPGKDFNIESKFTVLDYGHDYYAPQSLLGPDGRRIIIGWMDMWEAPMPEQPQGWAGMFSLPRELVLADDGTIKINPISEVRNYHGEENNLGEKTLKNEYFEISESLSTEVLIHTWDLENSSAEKYGIRIGDKDLAEEGVYLYVDTQAKRLVLDRHYPEYKIYGYRSIDLPSGQFLSLRIYFDKSSMEVFVNDGLAVISSRIYPQPDARHASIFAQNGEAVFPTVSSFKLNFQE